MDETLKAESGVPFLTLLRTPDQQEIDAWGTEAPIEDFETGSLASMHLISSSRLSTVIRRSWNYSAGQIMLALVGSLIVRLVTRSLNWKSLIRWESLGEVKGSTIDILQMFFSRYRI